MEKLIICKPSKKYLRQLDNFKKSLVTEKDFIGTCELNKYNIKDWLIFIKKQESIETCRKLYVPETVYMLYDNQFKRVVGMASIRPYLNENYTELGGNIGYTICPMFRNLGYGNYLLSNILNICKNYNLEEVLLMTHVNNIPSKKVILKNDGVLKDVYHFHDDVYERYTIRIK